MINYYHISYYLVIRFKFLFLFLFFVSNFFVLMFKILIIYFVIQVGYELFENSIPNDYQFN
jgi:hypothetical protein